MQIQNYTKMLLLLCLIGVSGRMVHANSADSTVTQQSSVREIRAILSARLDSIELLKQQSKRHGASLEVLEIAAQAIKDSLTGLRHQVSITDTLQSAKPVKPKTFSFARLTYALSQIKMIDWMIAAVALVAVLCGAVLTQGVVASLKNRKKRRKIVSAPADKEKVPSPEVVAPSGASASAASADMSGLASLRALNAAGRNDQVTREVDRITRTMQIQVEKESVAQDMRAQVIAAAKEGMLPAEIARTYKMSIDQINLIIKMTGR